MKVVFLSHTARLGVLRVGSHHLARELASQGHLVAHVSHPVTFGHLLRLADPSVRSRIRRAARGPSVAQDGVSDIVASAPFPLRSAAGGPLQRLNVRICAGTLAASLRSFSDGRIDVAIVDQPLFEDVIAYLQPRMLVYRPTDTHPAEPLAGAEKRLLLRADAIVATSSVVLESLAPHPDRLPTLVLENGVEFQRFAGPRDHAPGDGAVFVGAIDHRFDWDSVVHMAQAFPEVAFRLAGPVHGVPTDLPTNVHLLGPVLYNDVPALLRSAAVGLLPLNADARNVGRSPMKYYEYLASGLRILAAHTPTLAARAHPGVALYRSPAEAAALLSPLLKADSRNAPGIAHARDFDWSLRASRLATFLGSL